jgi:ribosomal protein S18 acetylase RimI-like enzyme
MELAIRRATVADAPIIADFNCRLAWESEHLTLDEPTVLAGVTALLADPAKGFYTVAEHHGEIVGQTLITFEWSDWRNGWFWWIQSVYVRADARRGGVFRSLYEALQAAAIADPTVIGLRLYVESANERAQLTYAKLGLVPTDYRMMERYPLPGRAGTLGSLDVS